MALTVVVSAGKQFGETERITIPKLNLLGTAVVVVTGNLGQLDDVDYASGAPTTTGQALVFDDVSGKWEVTDSTNPILGIFVDTMVGATPLTNGIQGTVPAPQIADRGGFLRGDGTWVTPPAAVGNYLYLNENYF